jgi:hypothetical protein
LGGASLCPQCAEKVQKDEAVAGEHYYTRTLELAEHGDPATLADELNPLA